ncbi:hypothetical protein ES705_03567 [subsurface metagenome]
MIRAKDQAEFVQLLGAEVFFGDLEKDFSRTMEEIDCVIFTADNGSHTGADKTITGF